MTFREATLRQIKYIQEYDRSVEILSVAMDNGVVIYREGYSSDVTYHVEYVGPLEDLDNWIVVDITKEQFGTFLLNRMVNL